MMGTKERAFSPLSHDVSLEELIPEDNFYRRFDTMLVYLRDSSRRV
jgi:hypothetical protein